MTKMMSIPLARTVSYSNDVDRSAAVGVQVCTDVACRPLSLAKIPVPSVSPSLPSAQQSEISTRNLIPNIFLRKFKFKNYKKIKNKKKIKKINKCLILI